MASEMREQIEALLPHRPPFLFVDRILERDDESIATEWDVSEDLECFKGHFPGEPVLPGVLISEFVFQSGAILIYGADPDDRDAPGIPVLTKIENARFRRIVRPGETLRADVTMVERLANARYLKATVSAGGKTVAKLSCTLAVAEEG